MSACFRRDQLHQIAYDVLVKVDDLLGKRRKPEVLLMPAVPAASHIRVATDYHDAEGFKLTPGTGDEGL